VSDEDRIRQLELHYLANPDPQLRFALLTDDVDAETMPDDTTLIESAAAAGVVVDQSCRTCRGTECGSAQNTRQECVDRARSCRLFRTSPCR
jgi:hypothetical protein